MDKNHGKMKYPLGAGGRNAARLLFDFAIALSAIKEGFENKKVYDFACGTGWTSELLNITGYDVYGTDVDSNAIGFAAERPKSDLRIDSRYYHLSIADGHICPFQDNFFGNTFCFDSLHHMHDYTKVLKELYRVLIPGGRAIFVEPGSRHASSPETLKFLKENKFGDWWIEKDVDLIDVNQRAVTAGFSAMVVKPFMLPSMTAYHINDWIHFSDNSEARENFMNELRRFNWEDRVIFYLEKPHGD